LPSAAAGYVFSEDEDEDGSRIGTLEKFCGTRQYLATLQQLSVKKQEQPFAVTLSEAFVA
jgi:hypothetical protein